MKRIVAFMVCVYITGVGLAFAQNKPAPLSTPGHMANSIVAAQGNGMANRVPMKSPNLHAVNVLVRQQMQQIEKDHQSGKLTEAQAKAVWGNLMNIHKQENEYFKQNGQREITLDQKTRLTILINQIVSSI